MISSNVEFVYQNRIFKIRNPDTNETLLNYIRTKLKKPEPKKVVPREVVEPVRLY